jgi:hypothetical protein
MGAGSSSTAAFGGQVSGAGESAGTSSWAAASFFAASVSSSSCCAQVAHNIPFGVWTNNPRWTSFSTIVRRQRTQNLNFLGTKNLFDGITG